MSNETPIIGAQPGDGTARPTATVRGDGVHPEDFPSAADFRAFLDSRRAERRAAAAEAQKTAAVPDPAEESRRVVRRHERALHVAGKRVDQVYAELEEERIRALRAKAEKVAREKYAPDFEELAQATDARAALEAGRGVST